MKLLRVVLQILSALGKLFVGIFARRGTSPPTAQPTQPGQSQPMSPEPLPPPPIQPIPSPLPIVPLEPLSYPFGPQSDWWAGTFPITQPWGCTDFVSEGPNPFHPECPYFHEGIDFGMPCGTPIYAGRGVHVIALDPPGYGPPGNSAAIALYDGTDTIWLYHMEGYTVKLDDVIPRGTLIGYSGTRGYSTGCHLHFEVRPNGAAYRHSVEPSYWLTH